MAIILLDSRTINKIAAGEVVDCPASVVKELIENSIDAGSTEITIKIESGGRNLITVSDNGSGIDKTDMEIAFTRHATSKLPNNDLIEIKYLGFRGEALSAIAAVSRIKLTSKTQEADHAWLIEFEGGEQKTSLTPGSLSCGTYIEVRDLFFATPTRLKFLKTERAETQAIVEIINKLAMINYDITFSLLIDNHKSFKYLKQKSVFERLCEIKLLGSEFRNNSLPVNTHDSTINLNGHISLPTLYRGKSTLIYTFVNNRPIHDNMLIGAIRYAYSDFITKDKYPIAVLYLNLPHDQIDVNVHPHKSEVRFQNKQLVYNIIVNAIKASLSGSIYEQNNMLSEQRSTSNSFLNLQLNHTNEEQNHQLFEKTGLSFHHFNDNLQNKPFTKPMTAWQELRGHGESLHRKSGMYENIHKDSNTEATTQLSKNIFNSPITKQVAEENLLISEFPLGFALCQLHSRYIISQTKDCVIIVDQHAAHERLTYEYMKKNLEKTGIKRQILLTPEVIELNDSAELELLINHKEKLLRLGLAIESIGSSAILVRETPAMFGTIDVKSLMMNIIDNIVEVGETLFIDEKIKDICATIACYSSIRSGRTLKIAEMDSILRQMEQTSHSGQCNHGRPTYIKLSLSDIDKLFERR